MPAPSVFLTPPPSVTSQAPQNAGASPAFALGLVSPSTSQTPNTETQHLQGSLDHPSQPSPPLSILLDRHVARLRRMRRAVLTAVREIEAQLEASPVTRRSDRLRPVMITPTYAPGVNPSPRHISDLVERVRKWAARRGVDVPYVWCAELHESGRLHYHLVVWLPSRIMLPKPDKQGWWPHGMTNIKACKGAGYYVAKYATKGQNPEGRAFPKGLRTHGSGGLSQVQRQVVRWWCLPSWAREWFPAAHLDVRRVLGGFASRTSGEFRPTPWSVKVDPGPAISIVLSRPEHLHPDSKLRGSLH